MLEKSLVTPVEVDKWKAIANELNMDMWAILCAKAEAEAEDKWMVVIKVQDCGRT